MIILDAYSYFTKEFFCMVLLLISISIFTKIHNKYIYFLFIIGSFPLTLIAVKDSLLLGISVTILFVVSRLKAWLMSRRKMLNEIFALELSLFIYMVVPFVTSMIIKEFFNLKLNVVSNDKLILPTYLIIAAIIFVISILICQSVFNNSNLNFEQTTICVLQFGIFLGLVYTFIEIMQILKILGTVRIMTMSFLIVQFVFSIYTSYIFLKRNKEKNKILDLKKQMGMLNKYTSEVESNYQDLRKIRHDYKNMLLGMKINSNLNKSNNEYLSKLIEYTNKLNDKSVMRFNDIRQIRIPPLKSLIIAKLSEAEKKDINIKFECLYPINEININEIDLVRTVGILADNAIEASSESDEKIFNCFILSNNSGIEIIMENSFLGKLPSFKDINQYGYSSKGSNRGMGLSNVKEIEKHNHNMELINYSENGLFKSSIIIKEG